MMSSTPREIPSLKLPALKRGVIALDMITFDSASVRSLPVHSQLRCVRAARSAQRPAIRRCSSSFLERPLAEELIGVRLNFLPFQ